MKSAPITVIIAVLFALPLHAQWRTFAGGFSSRWNTRGHHGHDQVHCAQSDCDADDFVRANLDDSIGFRAGVERDFFRAGALHLVGGADAGISHTEYNLSQRDFSVLSTALFAGADVDVAGDFRVGARIGIGGYATSTAEHSGTLRFTEIGASIPLRRGAALRIARRDFALTRMQAAPSRDLSILLETTGQDGHDSPWEFLAATGTTSPGMGAGGDRKLRPTALNRTAVFRGFRDRDLQLEVSWTSTAHESSLPSDFRGYGGNFRSKTIEGYGLALSHTRPLTRALSLRWSGGVEVADWRDEHRLLTRNGEELVAGVELAATASAALRLQLRPRLAFEASAQKLYWRGIDLGELRWSAGIVLTR